VIDLLCRNLGAVPGSDGKCLFRVWAPYAGKVELWLDSAGGQLHEMRREDEGYFEAVLEVPEGTRFRYRLDGEKERADPASLFQPEGVHGPSEVTRPPFDWTDDGWKGLPLDQYVLYELHVGTFSDAGTFDGVVEYLDELAALGVTAIELMPIAQFPGHRNWGYDGVFPFAAQSSYGGPHRFRRLVNEAHLRGLAVVLDVVYNHLGPEGNHLADFGPYFTDRYKTFWGPALNFDGPGSDHVRRYFLESALYWLRDCHVDALRIDAVHAIMDQSAHTFLGEVAELVDAASEKLGRRLYTIAESDLNDPLVVLPRQKGGLGFDSQWSDDFHHAVHAVMTGERSGYYEDFGEVSQIAEALNHGYVYRGHYSRHRQRRHGASPEGLPGRSFVVFTQNHDQIGNRMMGDRLATHLTPGQQRFMAGLVLLSPFLPLLFMGEEYGETAPFQYFTSHSLQELIEAVRCGRRREFASFGWDGDSPDPQSEGTFLRSKLKRDDPANLRGFYAELLKIRRRFRDASHIAGQEIASQCGDIISMHRENDTEELQVVFNFGSASHSLDSLSSDGWEIALTSSDSTAEDGMIRPHELAVLARGKRSN
jgi:maltooligosyltrehalose trehalohydrolase